MTVKAIRALAVALALLSAWMAHPVGAEDGLGLFNLTDDTGEHRVRYGYALWTWGETTSQRGIEGSRELLGGRAEGRALVWDRYFFGGRVDLTAGAGESFSFDRPTLARSAEVAGVGGIALACPTGDCFGGGFLAAVGAIGKRWAIDERPTFQAPDFWYAGIRVGAGLSYAYILYGHDAAVAKDHFAVVLHLAIPKLNGSGFFTEYQMTDGGTVRYGFSVPVLVGGN